MQVVITTGRYAGRRYSGALIAARGYDPMGFLLGLAGDGVRWRIEGLADEPPAIQRSWSIANLGALIQMSLREGRSVRVGTHRWQAVSGRFAQQVQEIEDALADSGRHVFVLTEPGPPGEPGDMVIGLGEPE